MKSNFWNKKVQEMTVTETTLYTIGISILCLGITLAPMTYEYVTNVVCERKKKKTRKEIETPKETEAK